MTEEIRASGNCDLSQSRNGIAGLSGEMLADARSMQLENVSYSVPIAQLSTLGAGVSSLFPAFRTATQTMAADILPSEKAFAYKMKMDAMKRKAGRPEKNSSQVATNFDTATEIGKRAGESRDQVFRYIRLTELIPDILQMVDDGKIALTPAVELSYLQDFEQEALFSIMDCDEVTPSLSQAQRLRRMSEDQTFTDRTAMQVLSEVKGNQKEYVKVPVDSLRSYFHPDTSIKQMTETLVKAMEFYNKHLERQRRDRDAR